MHFTSQQSIVVMSCAWLVLSTAGCDPPARQATAPPGPPPPPSPAVYTKPSELPPKATPDPYEKLLGEVNQTLQRYVGLYANVKDEASAEKAAEQITQMSARLQALTAELAKIPYRAGQERQMQDLQTQLLSLQPGQAGNAEMQRVMSDPMLAEKVAPASLEFMLALAGLAQADLTRRRSAPPVESPPETSPAK